MACMIMEVYTHGRFDPRRSQSLYASQTIAAGDKLGEAVPEDKFQSREEAPNIVGITRLLSLIRCCLAL